MVLLESKSLALGSSAPDFSLPSVDEKIYCSRDFPKVTLLVAFICNHCPYVRAIEDRLIDLRRSYSHDKLFMVGICSNDAKRYVLDSKNELLKSWQEKNYGFPYLIDEDQTTAKNFDAVCTPDLFLFDQEKKLFYHGALDDNWQDAKKVTREYMKEAIDAINHKRPALLEQKPSIGCSI